MDIKTFYKLLGDDDNIIKIALIVGFVQSLKCSNVLENPLSAMCYAIIIATIYTFFANLVVSISPNLLKPLISIILIVSMIYYIFYKRDNCKPLVSVKIMEPSTEMRYKIVNQ